MAQEELGVDTILFNGSFEACVFAFGVNSGAYVAEIIRGGIASIDPGQAEAGHKILLENGVSSEDLAEFDGWSTTEVLMSIPTWLGYEIALRLNIHQLHAFECLNYRPIESA